MYREVIDYLNLSPGKIVIDATVGTGGHAFYILKKILPQGRLIGIDKDREVLEICARRLEEFRGNFELIYGDFRNIDDLVGDLKLPRIDAILFDLGVSSYQLQNPERGFSFQLNGPLDMRMDRNTFISAYDLVNNLNEDEISNLLWTFGQERWHNRIARYLVEERKKKPISTTLELAELVRRAVPYKYSRIHPATRTFQALRIAVNRELEALEEAIFKAVELLNSKARLVIISFHSLEDRIVKHSFRKLSSDSKIKIITKKPIRPSLLEIKENPSCRSAKMRVAERS